MFTLHCLCEMKPHKTHIPCLKVFHSSSILKIYPSNKICRLFVFLPSNNLDAVKKGCCEKGHIQPFTHSFNKVLLLCYMFEKHTRTLPKTVEILTLYRKGGWSKDKNTLYWTDICSHRLFQVAFKQTTMLTNKKDVLVLLIDCQYMINNPIIIDIWQKRLNGKSGELACTLEPLQMIFWK